MKTSWLTGTRMLCGTLVLLLVANSTVVRLNADDDKANNGQANKAPRKPRRGLLVTKEREAAALTFVKQHHSELAELLIQLKEKSQKDYQRAIQDLYRTSERLALVREKDKTGYELQLELWKTQSRVQLITARVRMNDSPELRQQLKDALQTQVDSQIAIYDHERQQQEIRLQRITNQIKKLETNREQFIKSRLRQLAPTPASKKKPILRKDGGKEDPKKSSPPQKSPR